ncbi:hypothetical protein HDEF_1091 [Candidatus Hamiltonella defensa 5AT (Acyrthosiphon pisum)]|uniref:Uncharacterized protein n=1 Tax=Hamiltonella defensa subsp. Acyrthosiphon pisum (strain 5AT) TaxID=572265 RepID=C4K5C2_HAMD5|nr:hypothetical protein HDEF_1091 [Candidatus Hamiltonella defensa 5AT (Acyrthosiphon pisum)]
MVWRNEGAKSSLVSMNASLRTLLRLATPFDLGGKVEN